MINDVCRDGFHLFGYARIDEESGARLQECIRLGCGVLLDDDGQTIYTSRDDFRQRLSIYGHPERTPANATRVSVFTQQ